MLRRSSKRGLVRTAWLERDEFRCSAASDHQGVERFRVTVKVVLLAEAHFEDLEVTPSARQRLALLLGLLVLAGIGRRHARVPLAVGAGGNDLVFNAAVVGATQNAEIPTLAPIRVPGIGNLPVLNAAIHAPAHDLHRVTASLLPGHVLVDATGIVLEVAEDRVGRLHWAAGQDHPLDIGLAARSNNLAVERVLVSREIGVRVRRRRAAAGGALGRVSLRAPWLPLGRERVLALWAVVVAMGQRVVGAQALAEGPRAVVLPSSHGAV
mmetsp:Transcript_41631/g.115922  ORF Transcript_41631/g.115922 Transcript_41631/m.115922 type:complete len:267 (-) Transcript_41631:576-1376(-)